MDVINRSPVVVTKMELTEDKLSTGECIYKMNLKQVITKGKSVPKTNEVKSNSIFYELGYKPKSVTFEDEVRELVTYAVESTKNFMEDCILSMEFNLIKITSNLPIVTSDMHYTYSEIDSVAVEQLIKDSNNQPIKNSDGQFMYEKLVLSNLEEDIYEYIPDNHYTPISYRTKIKSLDHQK